MIAAIIVLIVYLSFAIDFVFLPIPSEASTRSILRQSTDRHNLKKGFLVLIHVILLVIWLYPLVAALDAVFFRSACFLGCQFAKMNLENSRWLLSTGFLAVLIGRAITIAGSLKLHRAQTSNLVTDGIFSFSRHPIVSGLHITLFGLLLLAGSYAWLAAILFVVIYFDKKVDYEEQQLKQRFGELYSQYQSQTMRY